MPLPLGAGLMAIWVERDILVVKRLPKTRSGNVLRRRMRKIAECQESAMPARIEGPAVLREIAEELK